MSQPRKFYIRDNIIGRWIGTSNQKPKSFTLYRLANAYATKYLTQFTIASCNPRTGKILINTERAV